MLIDAVCLQMMCLLLNIVGKLSHWLQSVLGNSTKNVDYVLIDRASNRYKVIKG